VSAVRSVPGGRTASSIRHASSRAWDNSPIRWACCRRTSSRTFSIRRIHPSAFADEAGEDGDADEASGNGCPADGETAGEGEAAEEEAPAKDGAPGAEDEPAEENEPGAEDEPAEENEPGTEDEPAEEDEPGAGKEAGREA
jgi:hypothetical protein